MGNKADFSYCDEMVAAFEKVLEKPEHAQSSAYYTGVDLGTACVVVVVLDENKKPVAGRFQYASVVRDGMVLDYIGAIRIVRRMKEELEEELGTELVYAAGALPPGTDELDGGAVRNVIEAAGFEVAAMMDEPTAANNLLQITDGAIVDIGGGTTGISVLKDGKVVMCDDEASGGTHFSLVIAGSYGMKYEEAELYKRDPKNQKELFPIIRPVIEKIGAIIRGFIGKRKVEQLILVGGSSCIHNIEKEIEDITGISTYKPANPLFVTPIGIALGCAAAVENS